MERRTTNSEKAKINEMQALSRKLTAMSEEAE